MKKYSKDAVFKVVEKRTAELSEKLATLEAEKATLAKELEDARLEAELAGTATPSNNEVTPETEVEDLYTQLFPETE